MSQLPVRGPDRTRLNSGEAHTRCVIRLLSQMGDGESALSVSLNMREPPGSTGSVMIPDFTSRAANIALVSTTHREECEGNEGGRYNFPTLRQGLLNSTTNVLIPGG